MGSSADSDAPKEEGTFPSACDYLAMFPAAQPPVERLKPAGRDGLARDPVAELREANPLTNSALLETLAAFPTLRNFVRLQLAMAPVWTATTPSLLAVVAVSCAVLIGADFTFNAGRFPARNLAVGGVFGVLTFAVTAVMGFQGTLTRNRSFRVTKKDADLGGYTFAIFARWWQLQPTKGAGTFADEEKRVPSLLV
jgi:hypothetical protein